MKRKIAFITVSLISIILVFLLYKIYRIQSHKKVVQERIISLKNVPLIKLDSSEFKFSISNNYSNFVIIHFNTTCDNCYNEILDLKNNISSFDKSLIILVSEEPFQDIQQFQVEYQLNYENVLLAKMKSEDVYQYYGNIITPSIFVYDKELILKKKFIGETKVQAILDQLD